MFSKKRIIKTQNVIFDHTKFYDPNELNLAHILAQPIKTIVKVLDLPEMQLTSNEIAKIENFEKIIAFFAILNELAEISSIRNITIKSIEKKALIKIRALMSTSAATSTATPERTLVSEESPDFISASKLSNLIRRPRRPVSQVLSDVIAINTKSKKQAYATAIAASSDLTPYYSAFSVGLIRPKIASKICLHRDSLLSKSCH